MYFPGSTMTVEDADPTGSLAQLLGADPGLSRTVPAAGTEVRSLSPSHHLSRLPSPILSLHSPLTRQALLLRPRGRRERDLGLKAGGRQSEEREVEQQNPLRRPGREAVSLFICMLGGEAVAEGTTRTVIWTNASVKPCGHQFWLSGALIPFPAGPCPLPPQ